MILGPCTPLFNDLGWFQKPLVYDVGRQSLSINADYVDPLGLGGQTVESRGSWSPGSGSGSQMPQHMSYGNECYVEAI